MQITDWLANCAFLMTRDGAAEHYPIYQPLSGINVLGPVGEFSSTARNGTPLTTRTATSRSSRTATSPAGVRASSSRTARTSPKCGASTSTVAASASNISVRSTPVKTYASTVAASPTRARPSTTRAGPSSRCTARRWTTTYKAVEQNYGRIEFHGVHCEMNLPRWGRRRRVRDPGQRVHGLVRRHVPGRRFARHRAGTAGALGLPHLEDAVSRDGGLQPQLCARFGLQWRGNAERARRLEERRQLQHRHRPHKPGGQHGRARRRGGRSTPRTRLWPAPIRPGSPSSAASTSIPRRRSPTAGTPRS